jgi:hypothetical protein
MRRFYPFLLANQEIYLHFFFFPVAICNQDDVALLALVWFSETQYYRHIILLAHCLPSDPHFVLVALDLAGSVLAEIPVGLSC